MTILYTPCDIAHLMQEEIDKTNIFDQCTYNKEYRKIFQLVRSKMLKEFGVNYNWRNNSMKDDTRHDRFCYLSISQIIKIVRSEFIQHKYKNRMLTSGMLDAYTHLIDILNERESFN